MMSNSTSFYINLAGNVSQQAQRFGRDVTQFSNNSSNALSRLSSRLRSATSEFRAIGSSIGGLSNKINGIGNIALPVVGIGVSAGLATVGKSMLRTAADFEMANIRMNQIFGKRGKEATEWLQNFAKDTPMAFGDTQQAMMQLQTAGIDPMNGSLQALVDYNAKVGGSAENLNGYISAISKGFIKGKLSMEEINPLLERNVKVFEILAKETGGKYTADQMQKMLQEGKLGRKAIAALLRGMGKDAAGAAKGQMKTWDGLVSNLEDTWTAMQARFMEHGAFDALKKELGTLLDWLSQKMEDGTLDEFAKTVSETLITALQDLKDTSKEVKPILESIGSVLSWVSEQAGGYGNIAKFVAALYAANKVARVGMAIGQAGYGIGKSTFGFGKNVYGVGKKLLGRKGGAVGDAVAGVAGGLMGDVAGVQSVYVVNMPDVGMLGGGRRGKKGRSTQKKAPKAKQPTTQQKQRTQRQALEHKKPVRLEQNKITSKVPVGQVAAASMPVANTAAKAPKAKQPTTQQKQRTQRQALEHKKPVRLEQNKITSKVPVGQVAAASMPVANTAAKVAQVAPVAAQDTANAVKQATASLKASSATAMRTTANMAKSATQAVGRTVSKTVPMLGTGLALAEGASVLMDEETSAAEKSEAIGSIAGSTAGAIVGQALIPIPVVGAAIGGFFGEKLGSWLGEWIGDKVDDGESKKPEINPDQAAQQVGTAMGNFIGSEVGNKLAGINPVETKLDGAVKVALSLSPDLVAKVQQNNIQSNQKGQLQMQVEMGHSAIAG